MDHGVVALSLVSPLSGMAFAQGVYRCIRMSSPWRCHLAASVDGGALRDASTLWRYWVFGVRMQLAMASAGAPLTPQIWARGSSLAAGVVV